MDRNKNIVKISIIGILVNITLAVLKGIIGITGNSISVISDALNNLSDVLSSIITIIATKLSSKRPTEKHPYGYGRIEYFSSVIIAIIISFAGISAFMESFSKILNPDVASHSKLGMLIIAIAVAVKFILGAFVKSKGIKLNSSNLIASGTDAVSDGVLSLGTLIAAFLNLYLGINIEGYLGVVISIIILKAAFDILRDTLNDLIGSRSDVELSSSVKALIQRNSQVMGVYDLILHNYGPNKIIGSVHLEVSDAMTAKEIDSLSRKVQIAVFEELNIILTVGIYAFSNSNKHISLRQYIESLISRYNGISQLHGLYIDENSSLVSFDLMFDFSIKNHDEILSDIKRKLSEVYPQYTFQIIVDNSFSD